MSALRRLLLDRGLLPQQFLRLDAELFALLEQVAALVCLGYTNEAIARQLVISVNTVRSHVRRVLDKYAVASKAELRIILAGWDFESWYDPAQ